MTVIAALLTLVGFQMNDMIVVFDRIREMLRIRRREALEKLTNDAINETMSRTVIICYGRCLQSAFRSDPSRDLAALEPWRKNSGGVG